MAIDFDTLLSKLHSTGATLKDDQLETPIIINSRRKFEIPESYNTVIAYAGDVNSQIVTFKVPKFSEAHDLSACEHKLLRWKNLASGVEDLSTLEATSSDSTTQTLKWIVPPAAFAQAGVLEISITLCDLVDNKVAFAWNTASCTALTVAPTQAEVGASNQPAKDEVLFINEETRQIVAPKGFNTTIASYGDIGTSFVHFQTTRYIRGIDLLDANTEVKVTVQLKDEKAQYTLDKTTSFAEGSPGEGLVNFVWNVPGDITNNADQYSGTFVIAITFENSTLRWSTVPFTKLNIGAALLYGNEEIFQRASQTIIDGDLWNDSSAYQRVGGVALMRDSNTSTSLYQNEIRVLYDDTQNFQGIAIGTADNQNLTDAPVISSETFLQQVPQSIDNYLRDNNFIIDSNYD